MQIYLVLLNNKNVYRLSVQSRAESMSRSDSRPAQGKALLHTQNQAFTQNTGGAIKLFEAGPVVGLQAAGPPPTRCPCHAPNRP